MAVELANSANAAFLGGYFPEVCATISTARAVVQGLDIFSTHMHPQGHQARGNKPGYRAESSYPARRKNRPSPAHVRWSAGRYSQSKSVDERVCFGSVLRCWTPHQLPIFVKPHRRQAWGFFVSGLPSTRPYLRLPFQAFGIECDQKATAERCPFHSKHTVQCAPTPGLRHANQGLLACLGKECLADETRPQTC